LNGPETALLPREPAPGSPVFAEAWQAEVLAVAHGLTRSGLFSPAEWAEAFGAELAEAAAQGRPDTEDTYYRAALSAVIDLVSRRSPETAASLPARVEQWRRAYLNTPHGKPVTLAAADRDSGSHDHAHHDH
jgi:nitrile hydratase accessory protein